MIRFGGHKSHITLKVMIKAKEHGIDLITLPNHISYKLQPLDIACFRPFKQALRGYRNVWTMANPTKKYKIEDFA